MELVRFALYTQRQWTIERSSERGSGISVLAARHDDDDDFVNFMKSLYDEHIFPQHWQGNPCGVVVNVPDYDILISEFKLPSCNYIHFRTNPLGKDIIIMPCRYHGYPWPSLATSPYHSSPLAGLQGYIPYSHIDAVCMFELVVLLLLGHMWGSIGVHHLWARPRFSSSVLHVWFV